MYSNLVSFIQDICYVFSEKEVVSDARPFKPRYPVDTLEDLYRHFYVLVI